MNWDWKLTKEPQPINTDEYQMDIYQWPIISSIPLNKSFYSPVIEYLEVIESRRTRRHFNTISDDEISPILWHTLRAKEFLSSDRALSHRPLPSAGATHCISLLVITSGVIWKYNAISHSKDIIDSEFNTRFTVFDKCNQIIDCGQGNIILLAADLGLINKKYKNYESLIWRDSGVILGGLSTVCELYNLSFCPLGITGDEFVTDILGLSEQFIRGVGMAIIGSR